MEGPTEIAPSSDTNPMVSLLLHLYEYGRSPCVLRDASPAKKRRNPLSHFLWSRMVTFEFAYHPAFLGPPPFPEGQTPSHVVEMFNLYDFYLWRNVVEAEALTRLYVGTHEEGIHYFLIPDESREDPLHQYWACWNDLHAMTAPRQEPVPGLPLPCREYLESRYPGWDFGVERPLSVMAHRTLAPVLAKLVEDGRACLSDLLLPTFHYLSACEALLQPLVTPLFELTSQIHGTVAELVAAQEEKQRNPCALPPLVDVLARVRFPPSPPPPLSRREKTSRSKRRFKHLRVEAPNGDLPVSRPKRSKWMMDRFQFRWVDQFRILEEIDRGQGRELFYLVEFMDGKGIRRGDEILVPSEWRPSRFQTRSAFYSFCNRHRVPSISKKQVCPHGDVQFLHALGFPDHRAMFRVFREGWDQK